jgi:hypothetical protein
MLAHPEQTFSVQPLCSLCLCGEFCQPDHHRDTENTEVAQRIQVSSQRL